MFCKALRTPISHIIGCANFRPPRRVVGFLGSTKGNFDARIANLIISTFMHTVGDLRTRFRIRASGSSSLAPNWRCCDFNSIEREFRASSPCFEFQRLICMRNGRARRRVPRHSASIQAPVIVLRECHTHSRRLPF